MTHQRRVVALVLAALTIVALAACSDGLSGPPDPATSSSAQTAPSQSAPTSEAPTSDRDVAEQAVTDALREYFAVVDDLRQRSTAPLSRLKAVASGGQLTAQEVFTRNQRRAGNQQVGETSLLEVVVQQMITDASAPDGPVAQVDVCWDVSAVDVLDRRGRSIVTPDRSERGWTRFTLTNPRGKAPFGGGWRVSNGEDLEKAPCSAV